MVPIDVRKLAHESALSMPGDFVAGAARRLGIAASAAGSIYLIYIVLYQTLWSDLHHPVGSFASWAGSILSAIVALYLFRGNPGRRSLTVVGVGYEVILALLLAVSDASTLHFDVPYQQVSWGSVLIVLFPFLIAASPQVILAASLAAAAMTPIAMGLVFAITERAWPAASITSSVILPPFLCALLAWAPARVLQRLGTAVQAARRLGSYELSERLGAGAMGEVWRAQHRLLARPAAVKLIAPERLGARDDASRQRVLARFEQEARVTASLDSPHTVELYDFGVSAGGELFIVMELLDGVDAQTLVERFGPLPSERVVYLLMQACDSLEDAHRRGLVHRDIKPANLFVSRRGVEFDFLKVLDFGLVKRWGASESDEVQRSLAGLASVGQTAEGQIVGTPAFIAPEAALSRDGVDHRADLYALGCVSYWLLTGAMVFEDANVLEMVISHVTKVPVSPSARAGLPISPELEALTLRCLAKDPRERPASAHELRQLLSNIRFVEPWTRERGAGWWQQNLAASTSASRA
jgi:eukaryotic-like serine/threonine-protein kinase